MRITASEHLWRSVYAATKYAKRGCLVSRRRKIEAALHPRTKTKRTPKPARRKGEVINNERRVA